MIKKNVKAVYRWFLAETVQATECRCDVILQAVVKLGTWDTRTQGCCVFRPANGCSTPRLLVEINFLS